MSTSSVSYTVPSNGWTGSIDVTDCDLSTDIAVEDYRIFYDGVEQGAVELANWSKVSVTSLSYSGSSLDMGDVVRIERQTPKTQIVTVLPFQTISSGAWNAEFTRLYNIMEEIITFGIPTSTASISDEAYSSGWNGITSQAPSKNSIYDKINTLETTTIPGYIEDAAYGVGWDGDTTHAPSQNAVYDVMSATITQVSTNITNISDNRQLNSMQARLTVTTGTPYVTSYTGSGTIYYTPIGTGTIYLYNGSSWVKYTLTEISVSATGTSNLPYDVFVYDNSGTLTLQALAWTNYNTRATSLTYINGIPVQTGNTGRRYIGTFTPISNTVYQGSQILNSNAATHSTLWNYYNPQAGFGSNTNTVSFTAAGGNTTWYSNAASTVIIGVLGVHPVPTATVRLRVANASGGTANVVVGIIENNSSSLQGEAAVLPMANSSQFGLTAHTILDKSPGSYAFNPFYFVQTTTSMTAANPKWHHTFHY